MDPTGSLIKRPVDTKLYLPLAYSKIHQSLPLLLTRSTIDSSPPPIYVDVNKYNNLLQLKNRFSDVKNLDKFRARANPYEGIGKSIFMNRAAVKLANISAVYKLLEDAETFSDLAGGPGGFVQYIQYAVPDAVIYGMTLSNVKGLEWSPLVTKSGNFTPITGSDGTGNLYTNWKEYIDNLPEGVDVTTADGGFDVASNNDFNRQEFLSSRLIFTEITVGIATTRVGGSMVIKVFNTVTKFSADMIMILTQCFKEVSIMKPISSRPANDEKYLVCRGRLKNIDKYEKLTQKIVAEQYKDKFYITRIFNSLPQDFEMWLTDQNNLLLDDQLLHVNTIIGLIDKKEYIGPNRNIDIFKAPLLWGIPNTPDPMI